MKNLIRNSENRIRNSDRELMQMAADELQTFVDQMGVFDRAREVIELLDDRLEKPDLAWQELTEKEILQLLEENIDKPFSLLVAVRDKLKEKNGFA